MRTTSPHVFTFFCLLFLIHPGSIFGQESKSAQSNNDMWVGAYLASYNHFAPPTGNWGNLSSGQIKWDSFTHLFYFSFNVNSDGTLSEVKPYENMNPDRIRSAVSTAHSEEKPVLFTVGGWGNHDAFAQAIRPEKRLTLISNLVNILENWGFDGIDLDLEPIKDSDLENYRAFIKALHKRLQQLTTRRANRPLLTVATDSQADFFAGIHELFDQINLMTYDYSGAWEGWVSWHNSAVYSSGHTFPGSSKPLPSVDETVKEFIKAGVPASKMSIGIDFYGYVWHGGSGTSSGGISKPGQSWNTPPSVTSNVPYHKIMKEYFRPERYHWDEESKAAWLSIDLPGSENDKFITFDDERSIRSKFEYAKQHKLGGVFIWELSGGYRQNMPVGQRDILLKIVGENAREAANNPPKTKGKES